MTEAITGTFNKLVIAVSCFLLINLGVVFQSLAVRPLSSSPRGAKATSELFHVT